MGVLADAASWICLLVGSFFAVVGGIGILRLPDFYTRLHGGGVTDTLGAGLILVGLVFQADVLGIVKLLMILFFLFITSPTACHALASAALARGESPTRRARAQVPRTRWVDTVPAASART